MFINAGLRPHISRAPKDFETLKAVIRHDVATTHAVCSLMQRAGIEHEGFLSDFVEDVGDSAFKLCWSGMSYSVGFRLT
jgi:hypothetical protein